MIPTNTGQITKHRKLESLQVARFVAAFAVVALHISQYLTRDFGLKTGIFHIGGAGVDVFFVISGFIIAGIADRPNLRIGNFLAKRVTRIAPLYYLCTLLVFMLAYQAPHLLHATEATATHLIKSLLFIPYEKADGKLHPLFFLGWTLNYEMFFYILTTAAIFLFKKRGILSAILVLIALTIIGQFNENSENPLIKFYCNGIILNFSYGLGIYLLYQCCTEIFYKYSRLWIPGLALLLAQTYQAAPLPREIAFGIPAALLIFGLIGTSPPQGSLFKTMVKLGDASYSTYLLHPFILQLGAIVFVTLGLTSMAAALVYALVSVAVIIPVSLLSFTWVEQRARRKLNRWISPTHRTLKSTRPPYSTRPRYP